MATARPPRKRTPLSPERQALANRRRKATVATKRNRARAQQSRNPLWRWFAGHWYEEGGGWKTTAAWGVLASFGLLYFGTPGSPRGGSWEGIPLLVQLSIVPGALVAAAGLIALRRYGRRWQGSLLIAYGVAIVLFGLSGLGR